MAKSNPERVVFTVGHSTRPLAEFIALLAAHSVTCLADVRTVPRSRHNPQFNRETLGDALEAGGIHYEHVAGLGGFRRTSPASPSVCPGPNVVDGPAVTTVTRLASPHPHLPLEGEEAFVSIAGCPERRKRCASPNGIPQGIPHRVPAQP